MLTDHLNRHLLARLQGVGKQVPEERWLEGIMPVNEWPCVLDLPESKGKRAWQLKQSIHCLLESRVHKLRRKVKVVAGTIQKTLRKPGWWMYSKCQCQIPPWPQDTMHTGSPKKAPHVSNTINPIKITLNAIINSSILHCIYHYLYQNKDTSVAFVTNLDWAKVSPIFKH